MDQNITLSEHLSPRELSYKGFFKIWQVDPVTGQKTLQVDKNNTILYAGADILAQALAGVPYSSVSHMYIGYKNTLVEDIGDWTDVPHIDKAYSNAFTTYGSGEFSDYGYLRLPLAYSPSFQGQANYSSNIAVFTSIITTAEGVAHGADFHDSSFSGAPSRIFEVGLASALDPKSQSQDKIFSRASFSPLLYDIHYNLTIAWGVQFTA